MIEMLVARTFSTRNLMHLSHWKTKSYAEHVALGSFYDSLVDSIDGIVEAYQGAFGLINIPILPEVSFQKDAYSHLEKDMKWIADNRDKIAKGVTAIENLIDGLSELYLQTMYKLKNLS